MTSIDRLQTVTASTKRVGVPVGGIEPDPTANIASLSCTPLDPVSGDARQELANLGFHTVLQTTAHGALDIEVNDLLVVGTTEYPIRRVDKWTWGDSRYQTLYVEELR